MITQGLKLLPPDSRDFQLGQLVVFPKLSELPEEFSLVPLEQIEILDQTANGLDGDMCSAYATCGMSALQEGTMLYPPFSFAASKGISGDPDGWGQNMRDAFKSHQKIGAVIMSEIPLQDTELSQKERRYFDKYSWESKMKAIAHKKERYVTTEGPYNALENTKCALWMFRHEKRAVGIGLEWGWPLDQYILEGTPSGFGHMVYAIGFKGDYLIIVNSAGKQAGRDGFHLLHKDTLEHFVEIYSAGMFVDKQITDIKAELNWQIRIRQTLVSIYQAIINLFPKVELIDPPIIPPQPPEPILEPPRDYISEWAFCIQTQEGYGLLTAATITRNFNPGAIRKKDGTFLKFNSYAEGFNYLCDYLRRACRGEHPAYLKGGETTLFEFTRIYVGQDRNYSKEIAEKLGINIEIKIKELL